MGGRKEGIVAGGGEGEGENRRGALFSCCLPRNELTFAASSCPSSSDELESDESDDDEEDDDDDDDERGLTRLFVVGSAIFVVVVGVSSSLESDDESDDELEETARLLRFLCLFLCVGGFVAAGGIFSGLFLWRLDHSESRKKQARAIRTVNRTAYFRRRALLTHERWALSTCIP